MLIKKMTIVPFHIKGERLLLHPKAWIYYYAQTSTIVRFVIPVFALEERVPFALAHDTRAQTRVRFMSKLYFEIHIHPLPLSLFWSSRPYTYLPYYSSTSQDDANATTKS